MFSRAELKKGLFLSLSDGVPCMAEEGGAEKRLGRRQEQRYGFDEAHKKEREEDESLGDDDDDEEEAAALSSRACIF